MVEECVVGDIEWVRELYDRRQMWATAHICGRARSGMWTKTAKESVYSAESACGDPLKSMVLGQCEKLEAKHGRQEIPIFQEDARGEVNVRNPTVVRSKGCRASQSQGRPRARRNNRCSRCGGEGHNRTTCAFRRQRDDGVQGVFGDNEFDDGSPH
ncbi:hypothetical protein SESBI_37516 [Sesbania bispinosa]|nr:hypothetical protein SESBI_37516 [Sesbania bispinosa]